MNFICIASGPSLTANDCRLAAASGCQIIAVNNSWSLIPECHHIYAGDHEWWEQNHKIIRSDAMRWASNETTSALFGLRLFPPELQGGFNSGQRAILLAKHLGATRILLIGYDCSLSNGMHWHSDHSGVLQNPDINLVRRWHDDFLRASARMGKTKVINCSRHTELNAFPTGNFEEQLSLCKNSTSTVCRG